jgi:phosphoglycolate phosphatase
MSSRSPAGAHPSRSSSGQGLDERYDLFVFDLDGTLADTRKDLARSVNFALAGLGQPPLDLQTIARYVGNGARRLMERSLGEGAEPVAVSSAVAAFLEHYLENCLVETRLYLGVKETLELLSSKRLAVLTNKPLAPTRRILAGLGLDGHFDLVVGGDSSRAKKPDPAALLSIIEELDVPPERALLLGDTGIDVATARAAAIRVAGVTYGFRPQDFEEHPPDYLLGCLAEILG